MPKTDKDPILSALKAYEQDQSRGEKKAVLLTPQGGYLLYGNRFCPMAGYELEFVSDALCIQGKTVPEPLLLRVYPDGFQATGLRPCAPALVSLIFQINLGEDEPLRGILLARNQEARFVLFSDASVEELYRLSRKPAAVGEPKPPPDPELERRAEELRRSDLRGLTRLYLQGQPLRTLFGAAPGPQHRS